MSTLLRDEYSSVVIYDTTKKRPVGIFKTMALCAKYVFGKYRPKQNIVPLISHCARSKSKIHKSDLPFPITIRYANTHFKDILGDNDIHIFNGYPQPDASLERQFLDTRFSLYKKHVIDHNRVNK